MDKIDDNIIDFGSIKVPTKWPDVTLKMYQDIERFYEGKDESFDVRDCLTILTGLSKDEINALPVEFLEEIMTHLVFLQTKPEEKEPTNKIVIDGERYTVHTENKLRTGEYVSLDTVIKDDKHNYAAMLAILCRKDDEVYDSHFENEILEDRIKLWEKQPIVNVLGIISFFLQLYIVLQTPILLSLKVEEAINLTAENIESSRKSGALSILSTKLLKRKLRKLQKSIKHI